MRNIGEAIVRKKQYFGKIKSQKGGGGIIAKKWEPGNLVPSQFSGQIRKVEERLGKLAKIRKVHPKD